MKVPTFDVELVGDAVEKTLADIPEWILAECDFPPDLCSIVRFRVGDYAYSGDHYGESPHRQDSTDKYIVRKIIGRIVCE